MGKVVVALVYYTCLSTSCFWTQLPILFTNFPACAHQAKLMMAIEGKPAYCKQRMMPRRGELIPMTPYPQ
jgi:hypothetical protein